MKKKVKRKEKEIQNVVGGESDENSKENESEVWFGKQIEKEMEQGWTKKDGKNTDRKMRRKAWKWFLKREKKKTHGY